MKDLHTKKNQATEVILVGWFSKCQSFKKVGGRRFLEGLYQCLCSFRLARRNVGRVRCSQNFGNFRFGGKCNTFRPVRPTWKFPEKWKIYKGGPIFPVGISERNFVFHLHVSWIKYIKSSAPESIRIACFNLERLSRSSRLARPGISTFDRRQGRGGCDSDAERFMYWA